MPLMSSKRLFSLLIIPLLIVMVGCGGKSGGTAVVVPDFDSGLISDGSFEFGSDAWTGNATNLVPEEGNPFNTVNFADIAVAGNPFDVNLSQVVPITQGKRYTLTFRGRTELVAEARPEESVAARTAETRTIIAGIGLNEAPFLTATKEITLTIDWQTFTLTLDASAFGIENSRVLFDMGADTGPVILDDVVLEEIGDIPPPPAFEGGSLTNGDFESDGAWIGNAFNIEEIDGNRVNSANIETAGNPFDVNLSQVVAIEQGKTFKLTFKARTDEARTLLAGIGLNEGDFVNDSKEVNLTPEWQTFELTLSSAAFGSANSRVLFDMGADTGLVLIDDVLLEEISGTGGDTGGDSGVDTGSFDDGLLTNGSFENGASSWTGNAASVSEELLGFNGSKANFANVETAGNPFDVNLSQAVSIVQGETYTLTFKAKSDGERTMLAGIGLNVEPFTNNAQSVDLTTDWRTYTLTLPATDFGGANSRVLFDMGADTGVVIIDEVKLEGPAGEVTTPTEPTTPVTPPVTPGTPSTPPTTPFDDGLLTNGDFEAGVSSWTGNAANVTDELLGFDASKANFANIEAAGEAFNVNLSQVVAITQGETYTLTFKAKSDGNRSMLAGIGLNEAPFTNNSQLVNLTPDFQTFTLTLPASDFGGSNSRVLFDMGADTGVVIIDEVSLLQAGGTPPPPPPPPVGAVECDAGSFDPGLLTNGDFEGGAASWGGNAASVTDELLGCNASKANFANVAVAGNAFDVNLSQVVAITQGETYTLTFKAKSDRNRSLVAGIGLNEPDFSNTVEAVNLTTNWQTFTLTLPATTFGSVNSRVLFDMGADTGVVIIDEVSLVGPSVTPPPPVAATVGLPIDFELAADSYTIDQFGDAVFAIAADPVNAGNNTLKMTRPLGAQWWAGGTIALDTPVDATSGVYSYDLYSTSPLAYVELKFEQDGANFVIMTTTHGGTGWETLSFDTSTGAMTGAPSAAALVVFTPRITADGSHTQTADEMYFFDNIQTGASTPPPPPVAATVGLPIDFELAADSYTIDQFGDAVFAIAVDPVNASNNALKMTRAVGTPWWSGGTVALDTPVDATSGVYSYDLYSTSPLAYVELKFEQDGANFVIMTTTHGGTGWETLSFDTSTGAITGAPSAAALVVFTPRITADGSHTQTADEMYFFDNIQTGASTPPPPPVAATVGLPIDFELAADSYTIDQFGDAVFAIAADPVNAGNNTLKMTRPLGAQWWAGGTIALDTPVDATSGVYSYDLYSTTPLAYVELKFEQDGANFVIMTTTHGGTGWETLSFDTSTGAMTGAPSAAALVVFTPRITADGSHTQTADEMYFFDNIQTGASTPPPPPVAATVGLPIDFELAAGSYTIDQFGDAVFAIAADPVNASNNALKMTRAVGTPWWSGGTVALDTPVDATSGVYSYDLYSTTPLAYVELKFEQDGANFVIMTTTHGGTGWETLSFDTSTGAMTGAPSAAGLVVFTPRITADGSHTQTADEMYFFDNILAGGSVTPPPPPPAGSATLLNGDFENGLTSWTQIPDAGATAGTISLVTTAPAGRAGSVVRLEAAGAASGAQDVLLTQVVGAGTINPGDTINATFDLYGSLTGAGGVVFVELIYLDSAGNDNGRNFLGAAVPYAPNGTWTTHNGTKPAGTRADGTMASVAGGVMVLLKASCGPIPGCSVDAYIDNVTLTISQ